MPLKRGIGQARLRRSAHDLKQGFPEARMVIENGMPTLGVAPWIDPRAERRMMTGAILAAVVLHVSAVFLPLPSQEPEPGATGTKPGG